MSPATTTPWWRRTWATFRDDLVPELVFAFILALTYALAKFLRLSSEAQDTIGLIGLLILGAEGLIRWRLRAMALGTESLDRHVQAFGLAVTDRTNLSGLIAAYIDEKASGLADMQRRLAEHRPCELPVRDVFPELVRLLDLANGKCSEIRAIASKDLLDYGSERVAKEYFQKNTAVARYLSIRRVFVLDDKQVRNRLVREVIRSQDRDLMLVGRDAATERCVKWVYRPRDGNDHSYPDNSIDQNYTADWVLFDSALLIRHDEAGQGSATITIDPEAIHKAGMKFEEVWEKGSSPDLLPLERDEGKPKRGEVPRDVQGPRPIVVGGAGDVMAQPGEVA